MQTKLWSSTVVHVQCNGIGIEQRSAVRGEWNAWHRVTRKLTLWIRPIIISVVNKALNNRWSSIQTFYLLAYKGNEEQFSSFQWLEYIITSESLLSGVRQCSSTARVCLSTTCGVGYGKRCWCVRLSSWLSTRIRNTFSCLHKRLWLHMRSTIFCRMQPSLSFDLKCKQCLYFMTHCTVYHTVCHVPANFGRKNCHAGNHL